MSQLSVGGSAVAGLKLLAGRPWLILIWPAFLLGAFILQGVMFFILAGGAIISMAGDPQAATDPAFAGQLMARLAIPYLVLLVTSLLVNAMLVTAVNRAILRPDEPSAGYLRLGADELRQVVLMLAIGIPMLVFYLIALLIAGLLSSLLPGIGFLVGTVLFVVMIAVPLVRFSLAGAQTFDSRAIRILDSWTLTKGRFWPLLGAYALAWLMVVGLVLAFAFAFVAMTAGSLDPEALQRMQLDPTSAGALAGVLAGVILLYMLVLPIVSAVATTVTTAPPAAIFKQIAAQTGPEAVF